MIPTREVPGRQQFLGIAERGWLLLHVREADGSIQHNHQEPLHGPHSGQRKARKPQDLHLLRGRRLYEGHPPYGVYVHTRSDIMNKVIM